MEIREMFWRKPEGKRPLGSFLRREDNIKMDIWLIVIKDLEWIYLTHDRDRWQAVTEDDTEPSVSIKGGIPWLSELLSVYKQGSCSM